MKYRFFIYSMCLFFLQACYVKEIKLVDPLKQTAHSIANLRTKILYFPVESENKASLMPFVSAYVHDLERRMVRDLGLELSSVTLPPRKTYAGFPPTFLKQIRETHGLDLLCTTKVQVEAQNLQALPAFNALGEKPPEEVRLNLQVELKFWSTITQEQVAFAVYQETGTAKASQRQALEAALIERINARLMRQLTPRYGY